MCSGHHHDNVNDDNNVNDNDHIAADNDDTAAADNDDTAAADNDHIAADNDHIAAAAANAASDAVVQRPHQGTIIAADFGRACSPTVSLRTIP
ncbi:MAG: hypothetical protein WBC38_01555 [Microgenomates group bacterium]